MRRDFQGADPAAGAGYERDRDPCAHSVAAAAGPTRSFFERRARWDQRERHTAGYLAPLAAGLLHVSPAPERALDIGTGTGTAALLVAREFPQARVRGIDISEGMIERAKRRVGLDPEGRIAFRVGDAAALPWPDDFFDW
jgi:tRNA1(Val) A37 N6-methylase TrmN6